MTTRDQDQAPKNLETIGALAAADPTDAMLLNRLVMRGPDPLSIITVMPAIVRMLAFYFLLEEKEVHEAIEQAHKQGPGSLLQGKCGIVLDEAGPLVRDWTKSERLEGVWVFLADRSACIEEGYPAETSFTKRLEAMIEACTKVREDLSDTCDVLGGLEYHVQTSLKKILNAITLKPLGKWGHVEATATVKGEDYGFYVAYKQGHKVCKVVQGDLTFWGTDGSVTLEAEDVRVDKQLSPYFGIVFPKT